MKLYTFHQSGSAHRVRIALNLKGIDYEPVFVQGGRGSAELRSPAYLEVNPQGVVPALVDRGHVLTQSLPIIEYLEETHPAPPLLPAPAHERARVRALAQLVASDIQPLISARVIGYLDGDLQLLPERQQGWLEHWIGNGLRTFETLLAKQPKTGLCCHGDEPTLADIFLIPQVHTAIRFSCDLSGLPSVRRIHAHCSALPAFSRAAPQNQPDAPTLNENESVGCGVAKAAGDGPLLPRRRADAGRCLPDSASAYRDPPRLRSVGAAEGAAHPRALLGASGVQPSRPAKPAGCADPERERAGRLRRCQSSRMDAVNRFNSADPAQRSADTQGSRAVVDTAATPTR